VRLRPKPDLNGCRCSTEDAHADIGCLLIGKEHQLFRIITDRAIVVRALANGMNA
jgi:hypothetical protein